MRFTGNRSEARRAAARPRAPSGAVGAPRALRGQRGFSLIEVMVAMLVLGTALLGLARAGGAALAAVTDARARSVASRAATRRVELLRAGACATTAGSAVGALGIVEWWTARPDDGWVELHDSVAYRTRGVGRAVVLTDRAPC